MNDLISRQAAIMAVLYGSLGATTIYGRTEQGMTAQKETVQAIRMLPSADAVEVVRCKDCKHNSLKRVSGNAFCDLGIGLSQIYDFCSHGERKDE